MPTAGFAMVPMRASGDCTLSATDLRVLMAIAYHDRGTSKRGCYADRRKLADMAGVQAKHWSRHTKNLEKRGYITIEQSASDGRRLNYRVIRDEVEQMDKAAPNTKSR